MDNSTFEKIRSILVQKAGKNADDISFDTALEDLGIDSFDFIEFVFFIEDEFKITINVNYNDIGGRLRTIGDVAAAVDERVAANSPQPEAFGTVAIA